jgi:hypothetical protein
MWCVSKLDFMIISFWLKSKKNHFQNSSQLHLLRKCTFQVFWSHDQSHMTCFIKRHMTCFIKWHMTCFIKRVLSLRLRNWQSFFLSHHYQIVARMLTTNLNSINQILWILFLIIFSIEFSFSHLKYAVFDHSCFYFFKLLCKTRQQWFFLQQRSWLLHCQRVCDVRCLLIKFSLIFSKARRFRSLTLCFLQNLQ